MHGAHVLPSPGVEDYTSRSTLSITHETVTEADVDAYYRHRKREASKTNSCSPQTDAVTAKIAQLTAELDRAVEELHKSGGAITDL